MFFFITKSIRQIFINRGSSSQNWISQSLKRYTHACIEFSSNRWSIHILPFFQKEKTTHKIPRSVTATSNYKSYWTLHITCFCLFLVLLCCRRPRDGHGARGGTPQGEWHAVRDFLWHRDWHPNVRWTQPQWHGNLQRKTFQYNRVYNVMHTAGNTGNIGIKGFPEENFQQ